MTFCMALHCAEGCSCRLLINVTGKSMRVNEFFSASYQEARTKFLNAAVAANIDISSHRLPTHKGPDGLELFIDVGHRRAEEQRSLLVVISGTHGVESFCGSGCQVGLLLDEVYRALPNS